MLKECSKCKELKELHEFYTKRRKELYPASNAGVSSDCRECFKESRRKFNRKYPEKVRERDLKGKYGIDLNKYNAMFAEQQGLCAGCNRHQSEFERVFAVDHNHDTGQVRGLLCSPCNVALGMLEENINTLQSLIKYINHYSELAVSNTNVVSISLKKVG